ncbi:PepSY domain-containing protein [Nonomuraea rubra]|uniref:PepSY domain-containing protein n=1 Tax=Nonomuraea rubra TaxID=46180 RepID=UPI00360BFB92
MPSDLGECFTFRWAASRYEQDDHWGPGRCVGAGGRLRHRGARGGAAGRPVLADHRHRDGHHRSAGEPHGLPGAGDLKQAAQAALGAVPGSTLVSIETEENGRLWEVQVVGEDGTEHQLDVESGKVVSGPTTEQEDNADKAKHRARVSAAELDYAQAADKIAAAVPEGRITELNLDTEQGKTVWEADVIGADGTKHEVAVDAATGSVTRNNSATT